jgi:hypothetical protein
MERKEEGEPEGKKCKKERKTSNRSMNRCFFGVYVGCVLRGTRNGTRSCDPETTVLPIPSGVARRRFIQANEPCHSPFPNDLNAKAQGATS